MTSIIVFYLWNLCFFTTLFPIWNPIDLLFLRTRFYNRTCWCLTSEIRCLFILNWFILWIRRRSNCYMMIWCPFLRWGGYTLFLEMRRRLGGSRYYGGIFGFSNNKFIVNRTVIIGWMVVIIYWVMLTSNGVPFIVDGLI